MGRAAPDLDTTLIRPSAHRGLFLTSPGTRLERRGLSVSAWLQAEHAPLVIADGSAVVSELIPFRASLYLGASFGVSDALGVEVSLPVFAVSSDSEHVSMSSVAVGDASLNAQLRIATHGPFGIALRAEFWLPTSTGGSLVGEQGLRLAPGLLADLRIGPFVAMLSFALLLRAPVQAGPGLEVGHELLWVWGLASAERDSTVRWVAEVHHRASLPGPEAAGPNPALFVAGLEMQPEGSTFALGLFLGSALSTGYGAADLRVLAGLRVPLEFDHDPEETGRSDPAFASTQSPPDEKAARAQLDRLLLLPKELEIAASPEREATRDPDDCRGLGASIDFEHGQANLTPEARRHVRAAATELIERPFILDVTIEGTASTEGSAAHNWALSMKRSIAVLEQLVEFGVSPLRLAVRGLGELSARRDPAGVAVLAPARRVRLCVTRAMDELEEPPEWMKRSVGIPWNEENTRDGATPP